MKGKRIRGILLGTLTAALLLGLCGCGKKETIHIASKPMTESYILTEMLKQIIEHDTDYTVEITKGVGGGTTNIQPALEKGEFDLYPEYTRTGWLNVLKMPEMEKDDAKLFEELQAGYAEKGLTWMGLTASPTPTAWPCGRTGQRSWGSAPTPTWQSDPAS